MRKARPYAGLLAIMIGMIVMLGAPSHAHAHAGHAHAASTASATSHDVEIDAAADASALAADEVLAQEVSAETKKPGGPNNPSGCLGGCCTASHACCAFALETPPGDDAPIWTWTRTHGVNLPIPDGEIPSAQPKPPRSFA